MWTELFPSSKISYDEKNGRKARRVGHTNETHEGGLGWRSDGLMETSGGRNRSVGLSEKAYIFGTVHTHC